MAVEVRNERLSDKIANDLARVHSISHEIH